MVNGWELNTRKIFLAIADLDEFDYAVLLHCFEKMLTSRKRYFRKTNLMWDLNLTPNFYSRVADAVDKLVKKGFLVEHQYSKSRCENPRMVYWLSKSGSCFCEGLIRTKKS